MTKNGPPSQKGAIKFTLIRIMERKLIKSFPVLLLPPVASEALLVFLRSSETRPVILTQMRCLFSSAGV